MEWSPSDLYVANYLANRKRTMRLLLLGSGHCGKSTLFRQLECIYEEGFTENEFKEVMPNIRRNCVAAIICLLKKSEQLYKMDTVHDQNCYIDLSIDNENRDKLIDSIQNIALYATDTSDDYEQNPGIMQYLHSKIGPVRAINDYLEDQIQSAKDKLHELGQDLDYIIEKLEPELILH